MVFEKAGKGDSLGGRRRRRKRRRRRRRMERQVGYGNSWRREEGRE